MSIESSDLTLVLVHGAGSSATIWDRLLPLLGEARRVLAPNLPGHGGEPGPGRSSIDEYATWLEAYLASHANGPVVLGGHSMGGAIALQTALRARVDPSAGSGQGLAGLVLVSTGARLRVQPDFLAGLRTDFDATIRAAAPYAYGAAAPLEIRQESQVRIEQAGQAVVCTDFEACDAFDVMARLDRIALPTLVVCGTADLITPPKYAQYLAQQVPGARLELLDNIGHMLPAEDPAGLAAAIADFLDELADDRGDLDHYGA